MAPFVVVPEGVVVALAEVVEPDVAEEEVVLEVVPEAVAIAAAWKAEKLFSAVGLTAKTIPLAQCLRI